MGFYSLKNVKNITFFLNVFQREILEMVTVYDILTALEAIIL